MNDIKAVRSRTIEQVLSAANQWLDANKQVPATEEAREPVEKFVGRLRTYGAATVVELQEAVTLRIDSANDILQRLKEPECELTTVVPPEDERPELNPHPKVSNTGSSLDSDSGFDFELTRDPAPQPASEPDKMALNEGDFTAADPVSSDFDLSLAEPSDPQSVGSQTSEPAKTSVAPEVEDVMLVPISGDSGDLELALIPTGGSNPHKSDESKPDDQKDIFEIDFEIPDELALSDEDFGSDNSDFSASDFDLALADEPSSDLERSDLENSAADYLNNHGQPYRSPSRFDSWEDYIPEVALKVKEPEPPLPPEEIFPKLISAAKRDVTLHAEAHAQALASGNTEAAKAHFQAMVTAGWAVTGLEEHQKQNPTTVDEVRTAVRKAVREDEAFLAQLNTFARISWQTEQVKEPKPVEPAPTIMQKILGFLLPWSEETNEVA